uniref:Uncharacterized protein n=1 Tax=Anguilla anguilla TaxID=7936 RepID=A0A0E9W5X1_ANGAN
MQIIYQNNIVPFEQTLKFNFSFSRSIF